MILMKQKRLEFNTFMSFLRACLFWLLPFLLGRFQDGRFRTRLYLTLCSIPLRWFNNTHEGEQKRKSWTCLAAWRKAEFQVDFGYHKIVRCLPSRPSSGNINDLTGYWSFIASGSIDWLFRTVINTGTRLPYLYTDTLRFYEPGDGTNYWFRLWPWHKPYSLLLVWTAFPV